MGSETANDLSAEVAGGAGREDRRMVRGIRGVGGGRHDRDTMGSGRHEGKARVVMTIGEAATELGVEAHVLRHWENVGALTVRRDGNGYRIYDDSALEQARTVLKLRRVGLSLPEVTAAMAPKKSAAQAVVRAKIAALEKEVAHRQQAITFLQHTVECRHRYLDDCPDCTMFVRGA
ncbi:MerR family transcriptional regulator [Streptomyces sp. NPDC014685]|uniref:MerR family transcriptional regulator n=2 Tax=unclassified Streptomyces TaxID=2593676 RepID=UPI0036FD9C1F